MFIVICLNTIVSSSGLERNVIVAASEWLLFIFMFVGCWRRGERSGGVTSWAHHRCLRRCYSVAEYLVSCIAASLQHPCIHWHSLTMLRPPLLSTHNTAPPTSGQWPEQGAASASNICQHTATLCCVASKYFSSPFVTRSQGWVEHLVTSDQDCLMCDQLMIEMSRVVCREIIWKQ